MTKQTPASTGPQNTRNQKNLSSTRKNKTRTFHVDFANNNGVEPLESRILLSTSILANDASTTDTTDFAPSAIVQQSNAKGPGGGNGGGNGGGGGGGGTPRSVWLWGNEALTILDDPAARTNALDFLTNENITTVYLFAGQHYATGPYPLLDRPSDFADLIADIHAQGIEVYGLLDSVDVSSDALIVEQFQNLLDYNTTQTSSNQLDGVNFDIEPWIDPAWEDNQTALSQDYLALADQLIGLRDSHDPTLSAGPTMPFWFDTFSVEHDGLTQPMNQHTQDAFDYATVMAFRDTARGNDGIIFHAQSEIDYGSLIGKPVVIGVETNNVGLDKLTFYEEGESTMNSELNRVKREFKSDASFAGFAIQDFAGYLNLAGVTLSNAATLASSIADDGYPITGSQPQSSFYDSEIDSFIVESDDSSGQSNSGISYASLIIDPNIGTQNGLSEDESSLLVMLDSGVNGTNQHQDQLQANAYGLVLLDDIDLE